MVTIMHVVEGRDHTHSCCVRLGFAATERNGLLASKRFCGIFFLCNSHRLSFPVAKTGCAAFK
jgi:hypothetical protein